MEVLLLLLIAWSIFMLKLGVWYGRRQRAKLSAEEQREAMLEDMKTNAPSDRALAYWRALAKEIGYDGPEPENAFDCSAAIEAFKQRKADKRKGKTKQ